MVIIVGSVVAQIVGGQLARRPGLVKRMGEQIVFGDALVNLFDDVHVELRAAMKGRIIL